MNRTVLLFLAACLLIVDVAICSAFAFRPVTSKSTLPSGAVSVSPSKRTLPTPKHILPDDAGIVDDDACYADCDSLFPRTRRHVLSTSASLLSMTSVLPPRVAFAAADEDTSTAPFTALFTIQVDSNKPDEVAELEVRVEPAWSPLAAMRFKELVELGFYKECPFFRVLPGFIAQFGISSDSNLNKQWMFCDTTAGDEAVKLCKQPLRDEQRTQSNKKGTLSFAMSGKNTRRTQIFVNSGDNSGFPNFLDGQAFVPFARIVRGLDIIKQLNGDYGDKVNQGKAAYYGGEYFEKVFPKLSIIRDVKIIG